MTKIPVFLKAVIIIAFVIIASSVSVKLWSEKPESKESSHAVYYKKDMTVAEFGKKNNLPNPMLKKIFNLNTKNDLQKKLGDFNYSKEVVFGLIKKSAVLQSEQQSKNWKKIVTKFLLWSLFLFVMFFSLKKKKLRNSIRILSYGFAVVLFGVILGADPGPMGTIKDAIVLFGTHKVIFPPRMIALLLFLVMVFIANKFICSWGCQAGTFQDLLFRINRNKKDEPIIKQYKIPFFISNLIRIAFFITFTTVAFVWAFDIVEVIDPFKLFKPGKLNTIGWIFIGAMLFSSLFVYRPWCHLFCPFGLIGWLVEKISIFRIVVDYKKCIGCEQCAKTCPSTVMESILKRNKVIADCFSCGSCIEVCPADAIEFKKGKRQKPPEGKFEN
jgi:Pyruvate/2-oxoacid:ferredoxin oxidoreductase delta subunit